MDFSKLAAERYSVRKFQDRPVSKEDMDIILKAANAAPTGCNYQPQRIYVAQSEEALAKLNSLSKCIFGAKTVLVFACCTDEEWKNPLEPGVSSGQQDISIVATHAMLQAWEIGVGSCWVNYFANSAVEKSLGLPANEKVILLMPMGYPAEDAAPLPLHEKSKPISETVRFI